jgi:ubiquinone/menaquinone biosynthesis C-methylase UbiE
MTAKQHNHFETDGANYAKFRPTYPENLALQLSNLCHTHDCAIDIGCGTGQLTGLLTNRFERVIGLDPSQTAIDHATPHDKITYLKGAAEETLQPDQSVDLIVAAQAAHWFDMPKFNTEDARIAKPKAIVALVSYGVFTMEGEIGARFEHFYWHDIFKYWPKERRHVENGYRDLKLGYRDIDQECLGEQLTIERQWSRDALLGYVATWSAYRQALKNNTNGDGQKLLDRFSRDIKNIWPDNVEHKITWPIHSSIARVV